MSKILLLLVLPLSTFCAFYEASSDNSDCYDDDYDTNATTTTATTAASTVAHTIPATTSFSYYTCPEGWTMFNRTNMHWCMGMYANTTVNYTEATAEHACNDMVAGSVLTSFQTAAEVLAMLDLAIADYGSNALLYIGAIRENACIQANASCTDTNSYRWLDGYATGTDGFYWGTTVLTDHYIYGCAALSAQYQGLTDVACNAPVQGIVCGILATDVQY